MNKRLVKVTKMIYHCNTIIIKIKCGEKYTRYREHNLVNCVNQPTLRKNWDDIAMNKPEGTEDEFLHWSRRYL